VCQKPSFVRCPASLPTRGPTLDDKPLLAALMRSGPCVSYPPMPGRAYLGILRKSEVTTMSR
jgi:hypothetical protein